MTINFEGFYYFKNYTTRISNKEWKDVLLHGWDKLIIGGHCRLLKSRSLGCGVREVYLKPYDGKGWS